MPSCPALRLAFGLFLAASAVPEGAFAAQDVLGGRKAPVPAQDEPDVLPGVPQPRLQPGVRIFGPNGPITPNLRGGIDPADRLDSPRNRPNPPEKKPTEAEKAEALHKALEPKPATTVLRQQALDQLFEKLGRAQDDETAKGLALTIERIWAHSDSDTANLLMERGSASLLAGHYALALSLFDKLIALRPQWAEAWNKRATTRFRADDLDGAMADIGQALKLEPRHYGALAGMGLILERSNLKKQALDVFRKALAINPKQAELRELVEKLSLDVEGRDI